MAATCFICKKSEKVNELLTCGNCNVSVHEFCNGYIGTNKNGKYLCDFCETNSSVEDRKCELCPNRSGPLKKTTTRKWAHTLCCLFIEEVRFKNQKTMRPVMLGGIPKKRYGISCSMCNRTQGVVIKCAVSDCDLEFHVSCAHMFGKLEEVYKDDKWSHKGYCQKHYISRFVTFLENTIQTAPKTKEKPVISHFTS